MVSIVMEETRDLELELKSLELRRTFLNFSKSNFVRMRITPI